MKSAQITSFLLWGATAFTAVGMWLSLPTTQVAPVQPISDVPSASFSPSDMTALFMASQPMAPPTAAQASSAHFKISGIIFSNVSEQSRVLIPSVGGQPKPFAVGSTLPNGGTLLSIEKRRITYELHGMRYSADLQRL